MEKWAWGECAEIFQGILDKNTTTSRITATTINIEMKITTTAIGISWRRTQRDRRRRNFWNVDQKYSHCSCLCLPLFLSLFRSLFLLLSSSFSLSLFPTHKPSLFFSLSLALSPLKEFLFYCLHSRCCFCFCICFCICFFRHFFVCFSSLFFAEVF